MGEAFVQTVDVALKVTMDDCPQDCATLCVNANVEESDYGERAVCGWDYHLGEVIGSAVEAVTLDADLRAMAFIRGALLRLHGDLDVQRLLAWADDLYCSDDDIEAAVELLRTRVKENRQREQNAQKKSVGDAPPV